MATRWKGKLAVVDEASGDRRRFADGALDTRKLPMFLSWQREESVAHMGSVAVGAIDGVDLDTFDAEGPFFDDVDPDQMPRLAEDVAEAMHLARQGVLGMSVTLEPDLEAIVVEKGSNEPFDAAAWRVEHMNEDGEVDEEPELELLVTRARVMGATMAPLSAFAETVGAIEVTGGADDEEEDEDREEDEGEDEGEDSVANADGALVATVTGSTGLPIADTSRAWSGSAATRRMLEQGASTARRGHFYRDPDGDPETATAYSLPFADVIDGTLTIVPRGVSAAAGGRGVNRASIPESEKATIRNKICRIYSRIRNKDDSWPECPFSRESSNAAVVAMVASLATDEEQTPVPADFFADPELAEPTPIAYDADGHVFGHLALHDSCHVGFTGVCLTPPHSATDYAWFHRYPIETDAGLVWAGRVCAGGDHATLAFDIEAAIGHYDRLTTAAYVVAGTDEFGIWVAGATQPGLDRQTLTILDRRKISGDWRETRDGLELVDILALRPAANRALSEPGFPIKVNYRRSRATAMVACLGPTATGTPLWTVPARASMAVDYDVMAEHMVDAIERRQARLEHRERLAAMIAAKIEDDQAQRRAALAELVGR